MSHIPNTDILTLTNMQAKEVAGRLRDDRDRDLFLQELQPQASRPAPMAFGRRGQGLSALGLRSGGRRLLEVFHSPDAKTARSDGMADRSASTHLAARTGGRPHGLGRHPTCRPPRGSHVRLCWLLGAGRSRKDLVGVEGFHPRQCGRIPRRLPPAVRARLGSRPSRCSNRRASFTAICRPTTS